VPIIPDEARTFGMEGLFAQVGIYSHIGQLYEPVDRKYAAYYKELVNGQILEEGINEAGATSSFIAAGTAYATHGVNTIPFYTYYSMFGYQRVGDLMWLAGDIRAKGFLLGATAGRTTLNGEGLQHQDGHSPLLMSAIPNCVVYHPAYGYEIALIIQDGIRRMYEQQEDVYYYMTLGNENYEQLGMPEGVEDGVLKGLYKLRPANAEGKVKAHIFGDFSAINAALKAQEILATDYGVDADVWSATSYKNLRQDCMECERWNALHPGSKKKKKSYLEGVLENEKGPFIAVSEWMRIVPQQIERWVPGGLYTLGTDGFGRSESRADLRNFFETSAEHTVIAVLHQLAQSGQIKPAVVEKAIKTLGIDADQEFAIQR
jgi:pyruvate dehydrogenase E1 component